MNKVSVNTSRITKKIKNPIEVQKVEVKDEIKTKVEIFSFRQRLDYLIKATLVHMTDLKSHVQEMKKLQKDHDLLLKEASKKSKKNKAPRDFTKPRRATGFAEPVVVSDELYSFLTKTKATIKDPSFVPGSQEERDNWPRILVVKGTLVARTDVTSHITKYIKEHKLQNPDERREIVLDSVLRKLLSEPTEISKRDSTTLVHTYLQLQRYVGHHFPKKQPKV